MNRCALDKVLGVVLVGLLFASGCCLKFVNESEFPVKVTTTPAALFADQERTVPANSTSRVICWLFVQEVTVTGEPWVDQMAIVTEDTIEVGLLPGVQCLVWNGVQWEVENEN